MHATLSIWLWTDLVIFSNLQWAPWFKVRDVLAWKFSSWNRKMREGGGGEKVMWPERAEDWQGLATHVSDMRLSPTGDRARHCIKVHIGIHKGRIYKEYHSACSLVGIGTLPPPLSPAIVPLPPEPKGGHTRLRGRGRGSPNSDDWRKSLALCLVLFLGILL